MVEELEIAIRTKIAYHIALTYGAEGYVSPDNFTKKADREGVPLFEKFSQNFYQEIKHQRNSPIVKHHQADYGGKFPIWVAVKLFTFGMLSTLYSIMEPEDQKAIAKQYGTTPVYLESWIISLVELRNLCAHYGRLYNRLLTKAPRFYKDKTMYRSDRIFPILVTMGRMLGDTSSWRTLSTNLKALIEEYAAVKLKFIGFPQNWDDVLRAAPYYATTYQS